MDREAHTQIQWYPWSGEAFAAAKAAQKPMLISVSGGNAGRHPLYEDVEVVRLAEKCFIPVQVDPWEQPAVAELYRQAAGMFGGIRNVGTAVLADERGNPFFLFTPANGRELAGVLSRAALHWAGDSSAYMGTASLLHSRLEQVGHSVSEAAAPEVLWNNHYVRLQQRMDRTNGGFGLGIKGLLPQELLFLMAYARRTKDREPLRQACFTLEQMALGAVRDQIGGGFFHGTTDARWEKPVFEKRLVDQAWMLRCYTEAYGATGEPLFRQVAAETADYVLRELRREEGGFAASQWADGSYYWLTASRVNEALGSNDGSVFCREYSIGESPGMPHGYNGQSPWEDSPLLHELRMKLYRERLERGMPHRDDTVIAGQNGLMIGALAYAGRVLGVERYLTAAFGAEEYIRDRLVTAADLLRYSRDGCIGGEAALEDYAGYAMGLTELYRSGCGGEYLRHAAKVMARADALFSDGEWGGYFLGRNHGLMPLRPKQLWDGEVPSSWSVALKVLVYLAREIPHQGLRRRTKQLLQFAAGAARSYDCAYALTAMMET